MNLKRLFEMQRQLDERIEKEHPRQPNENRLSKKILALQVELGELANEWRGFKFWSSDQEPRTERERGICVHCCGTGNAYFDDDEEDWEDCHHCKGEGEEIFNPLLEEYVDCLHFILSIGLELKMPHQLNLGTIQPFDNIVDDFIHLYQVVLDVERRYILNSECIWIIKVYYESLFEHFISLGERLGFRWEQIEEAYFNKNQINHQRQEKGY